MVEIQKDAKRSGLYWVQLDEGTTRPATKNLAKGLSVYGEKLVTEKKEEFRIWDPYRSKLSAALVRGLNAFAFKESSSVLYLGASSGTTASHVSDLIDLTGIVYCVEFAPRVMRDLIRISTSRQNMIPLLADARTPDSYNQVPQLVDILYQDVAQPNQAKILVQNAKRYLRTGGTAYLAIKARSIDVTAKPSRIFEREVKTLMQSGFTIVDRISLNPFSADHVFISAIFGEG
ncbi:MAG: fibrillarin-like rRNA/tRNA 2'-O-methyltransferase [Candidatus Thorarchaeota archaeon]